MTLAGALPHRLHAPRMTPLKPAQHYPCDAGPAGSSRAMPAFRPSSARRYAQDLADADIGLIGVPFDGGVTNRPGARHGPREVRNQSSLLRPFNPATGAAPFGAARVRDLGDCWIERPYELEGRSARSRRSTAGSWTPAWCRSRSAATTRSPGRSCAPSPRTGRLGMIHIDAHGDTGDDYMGSRFHHGAPFRRALDDGLLEPRRVIQIGLRGTSTVDGRDVGLQRAGRHARDADGRAA